MKPSNPKCLKLLIIDDDSLFLEIAVEIIREAFAGSTICTMLDASNIDDIIGSGAFDGLIIDYKMPVVDGITVARGVRTRFPYLPIVLVTGAGDEEIATQALHGGVTDYLPKARMTSDAVRRTLERAIELCQQCRVIDEQRKELEMFAHALAHDFKQPLRQITTFANLLSEELGDSHSISIQKHLRFMRSAASRLTALVDVMSEYTLLNRTPRLEQASIRKITSNAVAALTVYISERDGVVLNRADGTFHGNETMMTYVVQNLITNGLKFNRSVRPRIEIDTSSDGVRCEISVSDNGIGIEEGQREAIFAPLLRLHAQDEFAGTGLGLTLARRALVSQYGALSCHANPDGGSRFVITVPCTGSR